jgi:hemoglobin
MHSLPDLADRSDIAVLVDAFYERIRGDTVLGPIFDEVAEVDWGLHLLKMYDFWDSVLFGTVGFKGDPLTVHRNLSGRTPMTSVEFDRWLQLFGGSVDALFAGPVADQAKTRAGRIAAVMLHHITADRNAPWRCLKETS